MRLRFLLLHPLQGIFHVNVGLREPPMDLLGLRPDRSIVGFSQTHIHCDYYSACAHVPATYMLTHALAGMCAHAPTCT